MRCIFPPKKIKIRPVVLEEFTNIHTYIQTYRGVTAIIIQFNSIQNVLFEKMQMSTVSTFLQFKTKGDTKRLTRWYGATFMRAGSNIQLTKKETQNSEHLLIINIYMHYIQHEKHKH